ncbi:MAG: endonuclease/exonuclease/phosphatase family protein [Pseudomonadota bacterium]
MNAFRLATWNIEWFGALFDDRDRLLADAQPSRRYKISRADQAAGIAAGLRAVDADLFVLIEAPNTGHTQRTERALEGFAAAHGLRQSKALIGFANGTKQEIAALYDPARVTAAHTPLESLRAPRFDGNFALDVDVDAQPDTHVFSKPPLELTLGGPALPAPLRLIGVHAKSKAPHGAKGAAQATQIAIANRRKQLAQCIWLRRRIDEMLQAGMDVIVAGDLNDGPGLDHYEKLFGRSSIEVVLGDPDTPETALFDPHAAALLNPRQGWTRSTARFYNREMRAYVSTLLDYVMVSARIRADLRPRWRIWHPFDDPKIFADKHLRDALLTASDHFPVSLDLG